MRGGSTVCTSTILATGEPTQGAQQEDTGLVDREIKEMEDFRLSRGRGKKRSHEKRIVMGQKALLRT